MNKKILILIFSITILTPVIIKAQSWRAAIASYMQPIKNNKMLGWLGLGSMLGGVTLYACCHNTHDDLLRIKKRAQKIVEGNETEKFVGLAYPNTWRTQNLSPLEKTILTDLMKYSNNAVFFKQRQRFAKEVIKYVDELLEKGEIQEKQKGSTLRSIVRYTGIGITFLGLGALLAKGISRFF